MDIHEITTKDGKTERVLIPGSEGMSRSQIQEILEWSKENSEKRKVVQGQKARYRKIPAIEAYHEMRRFREWMGGKGRIF
jgi:hypothetical protein